VKDGQAGFTVASVVLVGCGWLIKGADLHPASSVKKKPGTDLRLSRSLAVLRQLEIDRASP